MTPSASRKASERQRRKERGEVALSGWLSAEDHAALVAMAREAGMTQGQVVSRLIGMRAAVLGLERFFASEEFEWLQDDGPYVRYDDLLKAMDGEGV